jgi:hypothetical protein
MDFSTLESELANDPLGYGYSSMTVQEALDCLLGKNPIHRREEDRETMTGKEISEAIDDTEYNGLTVAKKDRAIALVANARVDPFGFAATVAIEIFGAQSTTITNLAALRKRSVSRAEELKYSRLTYGDVEAYK